MYVYEAVTEQGVCRIRTNQELKQLNKSIVCVCVYIYIQACNENFNYLLFFRTTCFDRMRSSSGENTSILLLLKYNAM
jgi:hypothetical protein